MTKGPRDFAATRREAMPLCGWLGPSERAPTDWRGDDRSHVTPPRLPSAGSQRVSPEERQRITDSVDRWRRERRVLAVQDTDLSWLATKFTAKEQAAEERIWAPRLPIRLDRLDIAWCRRPSTAALTSADAEASATRPLRSDGSRYPDYRSALAALEQHPLPSDLLGQRLLEVELLAPKPRLEFGAADLSESLGLDEALAHELAAARDRHGEHTQLANLPLRQRLARSPLLAARRAVPAVTAVIVDDDGPRRATAATSGILVARIDADRDGGDLGLLGAISMLLRRPVRTKHIALLGIVVDHLRARPHLVLALRLAARGRGASPSSTQAGAETTPPYLQRAVDLAARNVEWLHSELDHLPRMHDAEGCSVPEVAGPRLVSAPQDLHPRSPPRTSAPDPGSDPPGARGGPAAIEEQRSAYALGYTRERPWSRSTSCDTTLS